MEKVGLKKIIILIILVGIMLRRIYVIYTPINLRQHDVIGSSGHLENKEIKGEQKKISQTAAMAMFAIGLIFALTGNLPLGLGLMGASIFAYATTLDWDAMLNGLKSAWGKIVSWYHEKVEKYFKRC